MKQRKILLLITVIGITTSTVALANGAPRPQRSVTDLVGPTTNSHPASIKVNIPEKFSTNAPAKVDAGTTAATPANSPVWHRVGWVAVGLGAASLVVVGGLALVRRHAGQ